MVYVNLFPGTEFVFLKSVKAVAKGKGGLNKFIAVDRNTAVDCYRHCPVDMSPDDKVVIINSISYDCRS